ncbi:hypothetical protein SEA_MARCIE_8 [Microbacterium phage Marcie]|nr:hypothetical protein SEA_MARCIE_8 [Microbacterium phage Marcie]
MKTRFWLGFIAGIGAGWAALAIWQHRIIPEPTERETVPTKELIDPATPPLRMLLPAWRPPHEQTYYLFTPTACPNGDHPFSHRCSYCGFLRSEPCTCLRVGDGLHPVEPCPIHGRSVR